MLLLASLVGCARPDKPEFERRRDNINSPYTIVGPWEEDYTEILASSIAVRLSERVKKYYDEGGRYPRLENFWPEIHCEPLHNPVNGSSKIIKREAVMDTDSVGWIVDEDYFGSVYSAPRFGQLGKNEHVTSSSDRPSPSPTDVKVK